MRMKAICDRFEAAWRSEVPPDLAAFMAEGPGSDLARDRLLRGLLTLDLEFRIGPGELPDPETYIEEFPEYAIAIRDVFADFDHGQCRSLSWRTAMALKAQGRLGQAQGRTRNSARHCRVPSSAPRHWSLYVQPATRSTASSAGEALGVVYLAQKLALNRPCA